MRGPPAWCARICTCWASPASASGCCVEVGRQQLGQLQRSRAWTAAAPRRPVRMCCGRCATAGTAPRVCGRRAAKVRRRATLGDPQPPMYADVPQWLGSAASAPAMAKGLASTEQGPTLRCRLCVMKRPARMPLRARPSCLSAMLLLAVCAPRPCGRPPVRSSPACSNSSVPHRP